MKLPEAIELEIRAIEHDYAASPGQRAGSPRLRGLRSVVETMCREHRDTVQELRLALDELVKLQAHYAELLNMHDGGKRRSFRTADEWMARLRELSSPATDAKGKLT